MIQHINSLEQRILSHDATPTTLKRLLDVESILKTEFAIGNNVVMDNGKHVQEMVHKLSQIKQDKEHIQWLNLNNKTTRTTDSKKSNSNKIGQLQTVLSNDLENCKKLFDYADWQWKTKQNYALSQEYCELVIAIWIPQILQTASMSGSNINDGIDNIKRGNYNFGSIRSVVSSRIAIGNINYNYNYNHNHNHHNNNASKKNRARSKLRSLLSLVCNRMGTCLRMHSKHDESRKYYLLSIAFDCQNKIAYNNLANLYSLGYNYDLNISSLTKAEKYYKFALQLDDHYIGAHVNYGVLLRKKKRAHEALFHYNQALKLSTCTHFNILYILYMHEIECVLWCLSVVL